MMLITKHKWDIYQYFKCNNNCLIEKIVNQLMSLSTKEFIFYAV